MLHDKIVFLTTDQALKEWLLCKSDTSRVVDICRSAEVAQRELQQMRISGTKASKGVHVIKKRSAAAVKETNTKSEGQSQGVNCDRCGYIRMGGDVQHWEGHAINAAGVIILLGCVRQRSSRKCMKSPIRRIQVRMSSFSTACVWAT